MNATYQRETSGYPSIREARSFARRCPWSLADTLGEITRINWCGPGQDRERVRECGLVKQADGSWRCLNGSRCKRSFDVETARGRNTDDAHTIASESGCLDIADGAGS